jgi:hypothetical protein
MTQRSRGAGVALAGFSLALCLSVLAWAAGAVEQAGAEKNQPPWKPLFDGKSLAGWKATNFGGEGEVSVEKGTVVLEMGNDMTGITYARNDFPKTDYEVTLEGKRLDGNDFFCTTTFPVGDRHCSLVVGGWGGTVVGLSSIDLQDASENETTSLKTFQRDRWYRVRIRVTPGRIESWIDDEKVVDLATKDKEISIRAECEPCKPFGIATWRTRGAVRDIRVRTLAAGAKGAAGGNRTAAAGSAPSAPYDGQTFKGRIAWSADGNHNDEDDWAASPVALAIFAESGVKDRLVHFDYNCILTATDPHWESTHAASVLGAAQRYGYDKSVFHDCRKDLDRAVASIAKAINASTADNPLYFVVAGPMQVPLLGIQKSDPGKRKFVYCISHSAWNDGFSPKYQFTNTKRDVIPSGVHWVQIRDQNPLLSLSPYGRPARPEEWQPWHWMRDSDDAKVRFLWERLQVSTRADCSDAGMAYFVVTGDEEANTAKLRRLLEDNVVATPVGARKQVRLEAENFLHLDGYELEYRNDRSASHRLNVKRTTGTAGHIRTRFDQPYTAARARYDVDVRYFDDKGSRSRFTLSVNGAAQGSAWESAGTGQGWTTQTIRDVEIGTGDEIKVAVEGTEGKLDYVQLNRSSPR